MWTAREREIMRDIYRLISSHPDPTRDEAYWEMLLVHANEIGLKYDLCPMVIHFINAVLDYYEKLLLRTEEEQEAALNQAEQASKEPEPEQTQMDLDRTKE